MNPHRIYTLGQRAIPSCPVDDAPLDRANEQRDQYVVKTLDNSPLTVYYVSSGRKTCAPVQALIEASDEGER
jgi:hypothetical protein